LYLQFAILDFRGIARRFTRIPTLIYADKKELRVKAKGEEQEEQENPMFYALCSRKSARIRVEISGDQRVILQIANRKSKIENQSDAQKDPPSCTDIISAFLFVFAASDSLSSGFTHSRRFLFEA
jgi:hypothetical protein